MTADQLALVLVSLAFAFLAAGLCVIAVTCWRLVVLTWTGRETFRWPIC